ncbi:pathogenicity island protein [Staphylococcus lugdunensis]|uniref:pathogenicity island protein n=1 Tax=Staphylococcus lugdunensis TaxID=28035 RepID=UPI00209487E8|nr:pathogenicity island protein [Staphylococcus lugdunensis]MCO6562771.1 pathogenicity island protein [Staphylococcus lugdunensis]MCO6566900.1 pathogenicity island protein [Staphylococcus lugdunensis]MCO6569375.1 pathogenicity island protein [Staphylococcus lugdunensis]MCO6591800.1 pathogenicity island protein [Staphylococcus lugdunensis]MCO6594215.1 pathogenicity island protein [Staphylococcus lugdunensis]
MEVNNKYQSLEYEETKVLEYQLLTEYNPKFINAKIKAITTQIDMMYHLSLSHTTVSDEFGVVSVSYPLEKLVIRIIEEKDKLKWYKAKSNRNLNHLKQVIKAYTPEEQREIIYYMQSNGSTINYDLIERLQYDLFKLRKESKQKVRAKA